MTRYARQISLPQIGAAGQARLAAAHVTIIGAGGLGCPALQYLAGAGVGRITVLDPDQIEETNLHRQPIYRMPDLGRPKAEVAREALQALNPEIHVAARVEALHPGNAAALVAASDVVLDAADSFAVSYILSDACLRAGVPLISASVLGQTGYVGGFCGAAPSLRAVFPEPPQSGATCATAGVFGPVVGTFGALQAQMAMQVLLAPAPSGLGQMITADLGTMRFGGFSFLTCPEPDGVLPFIGLEMLQDSDLVIELRGPDEAARPVSPAAIRMTQPQVATLAPTDHRVVLCCQSGLRAWRAGRQLQDQGFGRVALLAAGACA